MKYKVKPMVLEEWERGVLFAGVEKKELSQELTVPLLLELHKKLTKHIVEMHEPKDCPIAKHLHPDNVGTPLCGLCEGNRD